MLRVRDRFLAALLMLVCALPLAGRAEVAACAAMSGQDSLSRSASQYLASLDVQKMSAARAQAIGVFYAPCGFRLAWTADGVTTAAARSMMVAMGQADRKGLRAEDYGLSWWGCRAAATEIPCVGRERELAQFDVDLTVAVMRFVSDLRYGRARLHSEKTGYAEVADSGFVANYIRENLVSSVEPSRAIQALEPSYPGYLRTESALNDLLTLENSEADVVVPDEARSLQLGDATVVAVALDERLAQFGLLPRYVEPASQLTFDAPKQRALARFQELHGLAVTGRVDRVTLRELNVPMKRRAAQLSMSLERWRWLPHEFVRPPVVVNIPEFRLRAYDPQGRVTLSMAVIVGRAGSRQTPILSAPMKEVTFHPYWNVPESIQMREIAPLVRRDTSYLRRHDYQIVSRSGAVLDSDSAEARRWLLSGQARVRQVPGRQNALGDIKFNFPNVFDAYMHGTPQTALFAQTKRDFSHGCIRVEDPSRLAAWVLRDERGWTADRIAQAIADPATVSVSLAAPIPVLLVYGTGIAAEDGTVRFFDDVYGYDSELAITLNEITRSRQKEDTRSWGVS
ncbi:hypothetical protein Terro_2559 [Terriglobus roseus DSM 18391]|uniref:L,D-TPase catalytic domain-containing protein n=1 Tax=Terriglobus roseus (strain DSM 18391 / NRRL B-41598 / KBS 63) TaxID=926566 RepID=I3ZGU3_TERRK|nr:hypothetical protein Terro_2195 [Terriglobus roseus DSM 18391]AFL88803.1 hypothetical protein Terro_2559 [Terriglobus roseus DSM 18391]